MNQPVRTPFYRTPFTDIGDLFGAGDIQAFGTEMCKKFEMRYLNCMEAYGIEKGYLKCADYYEDLQECQYGDKQRWRMWKIAEERRKQVAAGTKEYVSPPEPDTIISM